MTNLSIVVEGISQFSPDPRRRRVNKVYLKCDMCKEYCVLNVETLNDTYEDDINNAGGMLPWCLPKLIIESYLEEHIFKNLASENPQCVPVSNTATHSWNTNEIVVRAFTLGCNKLQKYLYDKRHEIQFDIAAISAHGKDWILRSELAGFLLDEISNRAGNECILKNGIDLKHSLHIKMREKMKDYNLQLYDIAFPNAATQASKSSEDKDESKEKPSRKKQQTTTFQQEEKYYGMLPKKTPRSQSKPNRSRFDEEKAKNLALGKINFDDAELYTNLQFIEYVDLDSRKKDDAVPVVVQKDKKIQKTLRQYWVGYTSDTRGTELRTLLHPDWIRDAYFEEQRNNELVQVKIFDTRFIEECMQHKANSAVQLTNSQKRLLGQTAFDCGYHPKQRVKMIRYKYQKAQRFKHKDKTNKVIKAHWFWQVLTEANHEFKVKDEWVQENIEYPHRNWYIQFLEPQKDAKSTESTPWLHLPIASSINLSIHDKNKSISDNSNENIEIDSDTLITEFVTTFDHKYLQKDHGDVCTLINVLNLTVYENDTYAEKLLRPLLDSNNWNDYLEKIKAKERKAGYAVSYVMQFLRERCSYEVQKHNRVNMRKLPFFDTIVCQINPAHAVVIYQGMIFDANYANPVQYNDKNLSLLAHKPMFGEDDIFEMNCYKINMKTKKAMKRKRS